MSKKEIMIDIETLSTKPNAIILSIACIEFNRNEEKQLLENSKYFYERIDCSNYKNLLSIDDDTLAWWNKQPEDIKNEALYKQPRTPLKTALENLVKKWFDDENKQKIIWSHSPSFDCIILKNAFNICDLKIPWSFWNERDTRTLFDITNTKMEKNNHHALYDTLNQINYVKDAIKKIKLEND